MFLSNTAWNWRAHFVAFLLGASQEDVVMVGVPVVVHHDGLIEHLIALQEIAVVVLGECEGILTSRQ